MHPINNTYGVTGGPFSLLNGLEKYGPPTFLNTFKNILNGKAGVVFFVTTGKQPRAASCPISCSPSSFPPQKKIQVIYRKAKAWGGNSICISLCCTMSEQSVSRGRVGGGEGVSRGCRDFAWMTDYRNFYIYIIIIWSPSHIWHGCPLGRTHYRLCLYQCHDY